MARELNLVKMGPVGGDSYRLYSLRPEGIIAGAIETTTLPIRTYGMAMGSAGQSLTLDLTVPAEPALKFASVGVGTFVSLQATSPGVADVGNINVSGAILGGISRVDKLEGTVATIAGNGSVNITSAYSSIIYCTVAGGNMTLNLPLSSAVIYRNLTFKRLDATAFSLTIQRSGAELIDGAVSISLPLQWQSVHLHASGISGSEWCIL